MGPATSIARAPRDLVSIAAAAGTAAWLDALRVTRGAVPPVPWSETASLALAGGTYLLAAAVAALAAVHAFDAARSMRGRPTQVSAPARAVAACAGALALLAACDFDPKSGWIAGAILAAVIASFVAVAASRRMPEAGPAGRVVVLVILVASWGGMAATHRAHGAHLTASAEAPAGAKPNFVFIVIDALRADHLGLYGYSRPTSPMIDRLAKDGIVFENAVAPSAWTLPSMSSILTSTFPGQHGTVERGDTLPHDLPKISTTLKTAGYETAAFTANAWLKRTFAFDDGFDAYEDLDRLSLARRLLGVELKNLVLRRLDKIRLDPELVPVAEDLTSRAEGWLAEKGAKPFFLYLHYMDVHAPYNAIPKYHGKFCSGHRFDVKDHWLESRFRAGRYRNDEAVRAHVIELYDEDIAATDESVGRLIEAVRASPLAASTTIVLVADHGEEFYEHGFTTHGNNLHREVLHVPLIMWPAGGGAKGERIPSRVSTLDLFPTLIEMAGLPAQARVEGISLAGIFRSGGAPAAARPIGSQLFEGGRAWSALYAGDDKLIRIRPPASDPTARTRVKLFHLRADPGEADDAAAREPQLAATLGSALDAFEKVWGIAGSGGRRPGEKVDPETLKQLKALGYIN
ncbi:MAG: sulfatase [Acidobacteria bacterium]|nr:sulfatase [Acidobacteriota bacterium]